MSVYPEEIASLVRTPKFARSPDPANAVGAEAKFDCGCFIRVEMEIAGNPSAVVDVGYRTNGCGVMVAAAESLADSLKRHNLIELAGLPAVSFEEPGERIDCVLTVARAFQGAFAFHRARVIEEFRGEKPLACTCFGVTEETVEEFIRINRPSGIDEVSAEIRAGSGCGSCRMLIQEIIDSTG